MSSSKLTSVQCFMKSVRGTKQYWFKRQSELKTMIREFGPLTFFLTFSCAEYEAADIANYFRKLNKVPPSYSISKLCTEDPISVSRKFSSKFHAFFHKVILNGGILGDVTHYTGKRNTRHSRQGIQSRAAQAGNTIPDAQV